MHRERERRQHAQGPCQGGSAPLHQPAETAWAHASNPEDILGSAGVRGVAPPAVPQGRDRAMRVRRHASGRDRVSRPMRRVDAREMSVPPARYRAGGLEHSAFACAHCACSSHCLVARFRLSAIPPQTIARQGRVIRSTVQISQKLSNTMLLPEDAAVPSAVADVVWISSVSIWPQFACTLVGARSLRMAVTDPIRAPPR